MATNNLVMGTFNSTHEEVLQNLEHVDVFLLPLPSSFNVVVRKFEENVFVAHQASANEYYCYQMPYNVFTFLYKVGKEYLAADSLNNLLHRVHRIVQNDIKLDMEFRFEKRNGPRDQLTFLSFEWMK